MKQIVKEHKTVVKAGVNFTDLLLLAFIVLKLTHVIDWSWVWVLAPLWIPLCLIFGILIVGVLAIIIAALFSTK